MCVWIAWSAVVVQAEETQTNFESPEAAAKALQTALKTDRIDDILKLFGDQYKQELIGGDLAAARHDARQLSAAMGATWSIQKEGNDRATIVIGNKDWPFPFPLVKNGNRWHFDTASGIEEVIDRRVGANERNAIAMCFDYIDAQLEYASKDRDDDHVLEYAQQISSTPGEKDGLYWESDDGKDISPFGPLVADARDYVEGRNPGDPYRGYYFKIVTRQSELPPGGRYDYIINGNMIAGFALISYPADYGNSGVMSFICNHQGVVYQADLGENSDLIAGGIDVYNPSENWTRVEQQEENSED